MAAMSKDFLNVPDDRYGISRANSLGRKDNSRDRRRSPSPATAAYCTYSRLSAMKQSSIFKKYLDSQDQTDTDRKTAAPNTENARAAGMRDSIFDTNARENAQRSRRSLATSHTENTSRDNDKPKAVRIASRPSSATRDGRKSNEGRRGSYQTIRQSLEQFASEHIQSKDERTKDAVVCDSSAKSDTDNVKRQSLKDKPSDVVARVSRVPTPVSKNANSVSCTSSFRNLRPESQSSRSVSQMSKTTASRENLDLSPETACLDKHSSQRPQLVVTHADKNNETCSSTKRVSRVPKFTNSVALVACPISTVSVNTKLGFGSKLRNKDVVSQELTPNDPNLAKEKGPSGQTKAIPKIIKFTTSSSSEKTESKTEPQVPECRINGKSPTVESKLPKGDLFVKVDRKPRLSGSSAREPARQRSRPTTPSFDEFKKRVRIPTFDEFRKGKDTKPCELQLSENGESCEDSRNAIIKALQRPRPSTSLGSTTRRSASMSRKPEQESTNNEALNLRRKYELMRANSSECLRPPVEEEGRRSSLNDDVFVAKGLRIKPSYIPDNVKCDGDDVSVDSPRESNPDNSLDDNILIASAIQDDLGVTKCDDNIDGLANLTNKTVRQMDAAGNFWIVLNDDTETTKDETEVPMAEIDVAAQPVEELNAKKPPLPNSSNRPEHDVAEMLTNVLRSTSDVSDLMVSSNRKRKERKERPHKSDPFFKTERQRQQQLMKEGHLFRGMSYSSIDEVSSCVSTASLSELTDEAADECDTSSKLFTHRRSNLSTCSEDSGVVGHECPAEAKRSLKNDKSGLLSKEPVMSISETNGASMSQNTFIEQAIPVCVDCGKPVDVPDSATTTTSVLPSTGLASSEMRNFCRRCEKKKTERHRTLQEIVETEATYRRDLKILKEEFYLPIKSAGLLSPDQLNQIFLNVDELLQVNYDFLQQLKSLLGTSNDANGDFSTSKIGQLFLKASSQFLAFKTYCINQASAAALLEQFERENELLKVFLQVAQSENTNLRKMNLKSFLVIPIQRITKYPLLLNRLYKATPLTHEGRSDIKEAIGRIEDILDYINEKTLSSGQGSLRSRRRKQESKSCSMLERFELIKVAQELMSWERGEIGDVLVGKLQLSQPSDNTWAAKKGKGLKFSPVYGVALTQGKPTRKGEDMDKLCFPKPTSVKQAVLILLREKNEEYQPIREPLLLNSCVVSVDPDFSDVFEIQEWHKESYLLKAEQPEETSQWVQHLKQRWVDLSLWRRRRNALANIMIKQTG